MTNSIYKPIRSRIHFDLFFLFIVILLLIYSFIVTWSASGQSIFIIIHKIIQVCLGMTVMIILAHFPPEFYENLASYLYLVFIILLIIVDIFGYANKGAQRWINLGVVICQPSEIAKIAVPLMISRFISKNNYILTTKNIIALLFIIFFPATLVAIQPDLGTAVLIVISGLFSLFLSGVNLKFIGTIILLLIFFAPVMWFFLMHDYQRNRISVLLHPERDPLGAGYHITQSKIAIGSGGLYGKGLMHGTQSQLEFLPEKYTDFIFAVLAEELGLIGVLILLGLYILLILRGLVIAIKSQTIFGQMIISELMLTFFMNVFVNIGMVSGILPIVGVPLPLLSYGGSSLVILMAGFGIIMSIHAHRVFLFKDIKIQNKLNYSHFDNVSKYY